MKLLLQGSVEHLQTYDENSWYSFDEFDELLCLTARYKNSAKILEQLGVEMINAWYQNSPNKSLVDSGLSFLKLQCSSEGFMNVIDAPYGLAGKFDLEELDESAGVARVHSTTILPRELERGILMGGLGLTEDLLYFTVDHNMDKNRFEILFVDNNNCSSLSWKSISVTNEMEWRFRHFMNTAREKDEFWLCVNDTLNSAYSELLNLATIDSLTGLYNRREFLRLGNIEIGKSKRSGLPLSLLYLDLDHFKKINDSFGHPVGDKALTAFASLCSEECREYDLIGRIGGEEFCIILPLTGLDSAYTLADRILNQVRNLVVELPETSLRFTVSIGLAEYHDQGDILDLISRADKELLLAKQQGRDRISKSAESKFLHPCLP